MLIDVFSDIVCPWCYVGEKRLAAALAQRPDLEVEVHWRPFQLRPDTPPEGWSWERMVEEKFGGFARAQPMFDHLTRLGAEDGATFNFDRIASAPNTRDGHRLILLAREHGKEWEMADALFAAYFGGGRDLNNTEHLIQIASGVGLAEDQGREFLAGDRMADEVHVSQREAYQSGIHSVPSYVINRRYLVQGAQEPQVFLRVIDHVAAEGQRQVREAVGV